MSTVTPLTRSIDRELIRKLFKKFSAVYGNLWNSRCTTAEEWHDCSSIWLNGLCGFEFDVLRKAVHQSFIAHKDFPPTLGQLVDICLHVSGVPSSDNVIDLMIRRDFNHPLVKFIYDKIGNWALSHGKPEEIKAKVRSIYGESLSAYRDAPELAWKALEAFKALPPPKPTPSKIPSPREIIGWSERFERYKTMAAMDKAKLKPVDHPVWEKNRITIGHPDFDADHWKDRMQYLMGVDETVAMTMSREDQYDRIRLIREEEARRHVKSLNDGSYVPTNDKTSPWSSNGVRTVYKHWMSD